MGDYQINKKRKQNKLDVEIIKTNINRQPFDVNHSSLQVNEAVQKEKNYTFTDISNDKNSEATQPQIVPSTVASAEIHIKEQECNTISDLSTLPSQYCCTGNNWSSILEKVTMANDATVNMLERYVKGTLFHRLKFISSPEMIMFSKDSRSLCQLVCTMFNVTCAYQIAFWNANSKFIPRFLNKKHADVCNRMKKQFQCKLIMKSTYKTLDSSFVSSL